MNSKKVVITGGAGFIGSNLASFLVGEGFEVHIIDRDSSFRRDQLPKEIILHEVDVRETNEIEHIMERADVVYHMAAIASVQKSIDEPVSTTDDNIIGVVSVLTAAANANVRRVVYSGSSAAYGNQLVMPLTEDMNASPVQPYGMQKYVGELFMRLWADMYGIETVSFRYFNVYGKGYDPRGSYAAVIGKFVEAYQKKTPLNIFGDGSSNRDYVHVSDVVRANYLASMSTKVGKGEVINIGTGRSISVKALAELFGGECVYHPARVEAHDSLADITKAKLLLDWAPRIALEDGIAELKDISSAL